MRWNLIQEVMYMGNKGKPDEESYSLLTVAQNNAIWTDYVTVKSNATQKNCKGRLCGDKNETIIQKTSEQTKSWKENIRLDISWWEK